MVIGTGIDLAEIDRIEQALAARHGARFRDRVYTAGEQKYCESRGRGRAQSYAARFAAKEAVMKALGTGVRGVGWRDIEVLPNRRGKPLVFLYGRGARRAEDIELRGLEISMTHSNELAMASVVGERALTEIEDTPRRGENALRLIREKGLR